MWRFLFASLVAVSLTVACGGSDPDEEAPGTGTPAVASETDGGTNGDATTTAAPDSDAPLTFAEYLSVGDCFDDVFDDKGDYDYSDPPVFADCDGPHDNEVYVVATYPDGDYPDDDAFDEFYDEECFPELEGFLGVGPDDSALRDFYLFPVEDEWEAGARGFACAVYLQDGPLQGSVRDVGNAIQPAGFPADAPSPDGLDLQFMNNETDSAPGDDDWDIDPEGMVLVRYHHESPTADVKASFLAAVDAAGWTIERRDDFATLGLETEFFDLRKAGRQIVVEVWELESGATSVDYFYRPEE